MSDTPRDDLDAQAALESWLRVSEALVDDVPLTDVLDVIAEVARDLTGFRFAMVALADESLQRLVVQGAAGLPPEYLALTNIESPLIVGAAAGGAETPTARAFRTGMPVAVSDVFADESLVGWRPAAGRQGYRSVLSIPLAGPGELGALTVYGEGAARFEQGQIDLLSALAKGAAAAIEIARLRRREVAMVAQLEDVDRMHQRLNRVALAGTGLQPILRSLSEMTGCSMFVEDLVGDVVGAAWPESHRGPDLTARQRQELRARVSATSEIASSSSADRVVYLAPVVPAGEVAAFLWATGPPLPMTDTQRRVFERGALVVAFELLKDRHAQDVESRLRGDLLRDLLDLEKSGTPRILDRARSQGLDLSTPHLVLVVRPDRSGESAATNDAAPSEAALGNAISCARAVAAAVVTNCLIADREGQVVMLLPHDPGAPDAAHRIARRITSLVTARGRGRFTASAAVGEVCSSPLEYRGAAEVASTALRLAQDAGTRGAVVDVADLGIFRLLMSVPDPGALHRIAEQALGPLRENQDARNADLINTLRVYLHCDLQPGRTAQVLHVHANTLAYRLRRIESLTGVSLRSSQGLLTMSFALAMERLINAQ